MSDTSTSQPLSDLSERDPCDGCDGECGDVCPVFEARRLTVEREAMTAERARCQHCPCLADERSFMCSDCASKADEEVQTLRDENERLRGLLMEIALTPDGSNPDRLARVETALASDEQEATG